MNSDNAESLEKDNQALWGIDAPDWRKWNKVQRARLWQAAALLCNVSPEGIESSYEPGRLDTLFAHIPVCVLNLIDRAKNHVGEGLLKSSKLNIATPEDSEVDLTAFATWANSIGIDIPADFPWQPKMDISANGWPWGGYDTKLLRTLAAAAEKWWMRYEPDDPTTAPTNDQVSGWLMKQGVSKTNADAIARILRADHVPKGRRKK